MLRDRCNFDDRLSHLCRLAANVNRNSKPIICRLLYLSDVNVASHMANLQGLKTQYFFVLIVVIYAHLYSSS